MHNYELLLTSNLLVSSPPSQFESLRMYCVVVAATYGTKRLDTEKWAREACPPHPIIIRTYV